MKDRRNIALERDRLSAREKGYTDLMRELWGSPDIWNTKKSYTEIASRLGVDEETVRNRVRNLRESGFLLGYRLIPNPVLIGRAFGSLRIEFKDRESKQTAIPRLAKLEGVINIGSTYDKTVLVTLLAKQDQDFSKLIAALGIEGEASWVPGIGLRSTSFRMTELDWEIISLLSRDAEKKLDEVARQLRVSTRTVKRRLNIMMGESAIFTLPIVDLKKAEGISYQLRVQSEQGKKTEVEKQIVAKIGKIIFRASDTQNGSVFGFNGSNVAEGNDVLEWVKQQPGVRSASMAIVESVVQAFDWLEGEVGRQISAKRVSSNSPTETESFTVL